MEDTPGDLACQPRYTTNCGAATNACPSRLKFRLARTRLGLCAIATARLWSLPSHVSDLCNKVLSEGGEVASVSMCADSSDYMIRSTVHIPD
jgi:hypothetical protein